MATNNIMNQVREAIINSNASPKETSSSGSNSGGSSNPLINGAYKQAVGSYNINTPVSNQYNNVVASANGKSETTSAESNGKSFLQRAIDAIKVKDGVTHEEFLKHQQETTGATSGAIKLWASGMLDFGNAIGDYGEEKTGVKDDAYAQRWAAQHYGHTGSEVKEMNKQISDNLYNSGTNDIETAKTSEGLFGENPIRSTTIDLVSNVVQMGMDAMTGASLGSMFVRSSGSSSREAKEGGATNGQALAYGLAKGTVEALTEKMFDGLAGIYGKGAADDLIEEVIKQMASTPAGQNALRLLASAIGEGSEEMVSDVLDPFLKVIYDNGAAHDKILTEDGGKEFVQNLLYDGLVGAILGGLGGSVNVIQTNNENARIKTAEQQEWDNRLNATMEKQRANDHRVIDDINARENFNQQFEQQRENDNKIISQINESKARLDNLIANEGATKAASTIANDVRLLNDFKLAYPDVDLNVSSKTQLVKNIAEKVHKLSAGIDKSLQPTPTNELTRAERRSMQDAMQIREMQKSGMTFAKANEIISNPTLKHTFEQMYGIKLSDSAKVAKKQIIELTNSNTSQFDLVVDNPLAKNEQVNNPQETAANNSPVSTGTATNTNSQANVENSAEAVEPPKNEKNSLTKSVNKSKSKSAITKAIDRARTSPIDFGNGVSVKWENNSAILEQDGVKLMSANPREISKIADYLMTRKMVTQEQMKSFIKEQKINDETVAEAKATDEETNTETEKTTNNLTQSAEVKAEKPKLTPKEIRELKQKKSLRNKISQKANDLKGKIYRPVDNKYIPADRMNQTLETLHTVLTSMLDENGNAKAQEKIQKLLKDYSDMVNDAAYPVSNDGVTEARLSALRDIVGDSKFNDMSVDQLEYVYSELQAIDTTIRNEVKVRINGKEHDAYELMKDGVREIESAPEIGKVETAFLFSTIRPDSTFAKLAGYKKNSVFASFDTLLNDGQRKAMEFKVKTNQHFEALCDSEEVKTLHQDADIELQTKSGKPIKLTHGMNIALYLNLLNEQNTKHIMYGGLSIPNISDYYHGKNENGLGKGKSRALGVPEDLLAAQKEYRTLNKELDSLEKNVENTEEWASKYKEAQQKLTEKETEIEALNEKHNNFFEQLKQKSYDALSEYDKQWVDAIQAFMKEAQTDLNNTTLDVYGFKKATVENYFPIFTDKNLRQMTSADMYREMSLENANFMKNRVNGTNPIMLLDAVDIVARYRNNAADYIGIMPAVKDFEKVFGKVDVNYQNSLRESLNSKYGTKANKYIDNLKNDLIGANTPRSDVVNIFAPVRSNFAKAILTLNPRVTLSQAASYLNAGSIVGKEALAKAFSMGKNPASDSNVMNTITKYTALEYNRTMGNSTSTLETAMDSAKWWKALDRKLSFLTGWINFMDTHTVGRLWYASEYFAREHGAKGMEIGSDEYYQEVAKVFTEVVEKTQPNYTVMQRPELLRSQSELVKSLTMFKTQQLQNVSSMYDAASRLNAYRKYYKQGTNEITEADVKNAEDAFKRTVASQVAANATLVGIKFVVDAFLHNMNKYRDKDDELTAKSILLKLTDLYCEATIGQLPGGSTLYDLISSAVTGEARYDGMAIGGIDTIGSVIENISNIITVDGTKKEKAIEDLAFSVAQFFGIPASNVKNIIRGIIYHTEDILNDEFGSFNAGSGNYADTLHEYYSYETANKLAELYESTNSKTVYSVTTAPKTISHDNVDYELTKEERTEYNDYLTQRRDELVTNVLNNSLFGGLSDDDKIEVIKLAKEYATDEAKTRFLNSKGIEVVSNYDKLTKYHDDLGKDATPLYSSHFSSYLINKVRFENALDADDYNTIDNVLNYYKKIDGENEQIVFGEKVQGFNGFYKASQAGVSSSSWDAVKDTLREIKEEEDTTGEGSRRNYLAIATTNISQKDKEALVAMDGYISKTWKNVHNILTDKSTLGSNAMTMKEAYDFFMNADWTYNSDEGVYKSSNSLSAREVYVALQQTSLDDAQKRTVFKAFSDASGDAGSYNTGWSKDMGYYKWAKYSYDDIAKSIRKKNSLNNYTKANATNSSKTETNYNNILTAIING